MSAVPATVLVVDDSPENRYAIRRYLSGAEFEVWEAETGAQGLEMAARDPDLILLDVHLPDINGFDVCRRLKEDERTRHIPVLQRSQSHVDDAARVYGLESGADAYLTEPVDPSVLVATARALLRVRRAENRLRRLNQVGVELANALTRGDVLQSISTAVTAEIGRDPTFFLYDESRRWLRETPGEDTVLELAFDADDPVAEAARTGEVRFDEHQGIVPLVAYGTRLGALTVPVKLSQTERELLLALCAQCAQALERAGLYEHQHHIASTLQAGLLPKSLPEIEHAELAARYIAGARAMEVGGDFYDVFPRGEDWVMVIGDVCGRGAEAAALTGLARHTIRAQAQHLEHPSEILHALHDAIVAEVGRDSARFVTAGCVLLHRDGTVRASFAGHPPALIARAGGGVEELPPTGPLLGLLEQLRISDVEAELGPGDALVLYTDGVIEARRARELFGEERLTALLRDAGPRGLDAAAIADTIREATVAFAGTTEDDTAILVLRRVP